MIKSVRILKLNIEVFVPGGLIGPSQFITNSLIILAAPLITGCIVGFLSYEYSNQTNADIPDSVFYNYIACCLPFVYFFYQNIFKRIRDYKGVNLNLLQKTGYFILSFIPFLNFYLFFRLIFSKSCHQNQLDHETNSENDSFKEICNIDKMDKLIKMRIEGHISDEEFEKLKEGLIKKAS